MATYYIDSSAAGGGNGSLGTPWNTWASQSGVVAGDTIHVKGTFSGVISLAFSGTVNAPIKYIGYTSTPGDGGRFTITGGAGRCLQYNSQTYVIIRNVTLTSPSSGSYLLSSTVGMFVTFINAQFLRGSSSATGVDDNLGTTYFHSSYFDRVGYAAPYGGFLDCEFRNSPGWSLSIPAYRYLDYVIGCRFYKSVSGGILVPANGQCQVIQGNTFYQCTGPAIQIGADNVPFHIFENLFTGNTKVIDITASTSLMVTGYNAIYNSGAQDTAKMRFYGNNDITLSAEAIDDPTVSWAPNNTAGGGALIRGASPTGKDIGAAQASSAGASGAIFSTFQLSGGF